MNTNVRQITGSLFGSMAVVLFGALFLLGKEWEEVIVKTVAWLAVLSLLLSVALIKWEDFKSFPGDLHELFTDDDSVSVHPEVGESYVNRDVRTEPSSQIVRRQQSR